MLRTSCGAGPTGRSSPRRSVYASRGQALTRHRHRRLPPMPVPRLDVRGRRPLRQRSVVGPARHHRTRCPSESLQVAEQYGLDLVLPRLNRHSRFPYLDVDDNSSSHASTPHGGLELLGDTHDRQHARRRALSVHARRNVRTRAGTNRPEVHTRATRRHLLRLSYSSPSTTKERRSRCRGRRRHHPTRHVDRIRSPVLSAQHHVLRRTASNRPCS